MSLEDRLREVLERGGDWQRVPVKGLPGVFVVKAPARGSRPASLMVELNPLSQAGTPSKRRGLYLRNLKDFEDYRKMLGDGRLDELLRAVEKVNPKEAGTEDLEV
jgi:hypothetical protein